MILYQLSRPVSYLFIEDRSKWRIDWLIPFLIALLVTALFLYLPTPPKIFGENGLAKDCQDFLQMLPGFFLAALAAIATFNKQDLDYLLPAPTPKIEVIIRGKSVKIDLTRRRMLSYLFGYLTFLSLCLYLFILAGEAIAPSYESFEYKDIASAFIFLIFQLFFWQMIIVTIFGLYQLCDRIHQPDEPTGGQ